MDSSGKPASKSRPVGGAAAVFEAIKLDFNTIRIIVLTAGVVLALIATPLYFILRNFVSFDALDDYFKVTARVRPKILSAISEALDAGYSRNFIFDSPRFKDNTMLFYASATQKVTLSVGAEPLAGAFPATALYVNNCLIEKRTEPFHFYEKEITAKLESCPPDELNLHTLRIVFPAGLKQSAIQLKCLILVNQRVHEHVGEVSRK